jgi:hypothetical protein
LVVTKREGYAADVAVKLALVIAAVDGGVDRVRENPKGLDCPIIIAPRATNAVERSRWLYGDVRRVKVLSKVTGLPDIILVRAGIISHKVKVTTVPQLAAVTSPCGL